MLGTAQKCDCCGRETLAYGLPDEGALEIRDRRHGIHHVKRLELAELMHMLDPLGTSFRPVVIGSHGQP